MQIKTPFQGMKVPLYSFSFWTKVLGVPCSGMSAAVTMTPTSEGSLEPSSFFSDVAAW
jgi:hypothetical protein